MSRPKGKLLRKKPYQITKHGKCSMSITISDMADVEKGDLFYQEQMENGIILLIPEKIIREEQ